MTRQGPASVDQLHALHRLLCRALARALKADEPAADYLKAAGRFVADYGAPVPLGVRELRAIRRLRRLYLEKLTAAITGPDAAPNASMLAEVRHAISAHEPGRDLSERSDTAVAVQALAFAALPFGISSS